MKFKKDYGVYCCKHVFENSRPCLFTVRDFDGSWQFLCGDATCPKSGPPKLIGVGHLIDNDSAIDKLAILNNGTCAERKNKKSNWKISDL